MSNGNRKDPLPEITAEMIFKWASQGLQRKQMARRAGMAYTTFNQIVTRSKTLIIAELKGKIKFYE